MRLALLAGLLLLAIGGCAAAAADATNAEENNELADAADFFPSMLDDETQAGDNYEDSEVEQKAESPDNAVFEDGNSDVEDQESIDSPEAKLRGYWYTRRRRGRRFGRRFGRFYRHRYGQRSGGFRPSRRRFGRRLRGLASLLNALSKQSASLTDCVKLSKSQQISLKHWNRRLRRFRPRSMAKKAKKAKKDKKVNSKPKAPAAVDKIDNMVGSQQEDEFETLEQP